MKKLFVLFAVVALVLAFTVPGIAAEEKKKKTIEERIVDLESPGVQWSFYGSARMSTFWTSVSEEMGPTGEDDLDLAHVLHGNSRIGAKVKVGDNLTGQFEYGSTPNLRVLWGEYDFGGFKLGVGQNYVPLCLFYSNQAYGPDNGFLDVGGVYVGRDPMVQAKIGSLSVALVQPLTPDLGYEDTDVTIPQIQAKYTLKVAGLGLALAGGYQQYDVVTADDSSDKVAAYMVALGASYNMGPFSIGGNYWTGKNAGNMGQVTWGVAPDISAGADADGVLDNSAYGYHVIVGFTLSDMLRFEGGYGFESADLDDAHSKDEVSGYYLQAKVNLAKGVFIVPEFGYYDKKDDAAGAEEGTITYYGLKWQISF